MLIFERSIDRGRKYNIEKHFPHEIPTTITIAEATAINVVLNYIINSDINTINIIHIHCDNYSILSFLKCYTFPKYNNIKLIIESSFIKLIKIQDKYPHLLIKFHKVKSHSKNIYNK